MTKAHQQTPEAGGPTPFLIDLAKSTSASPCREMVDARDYTTLEDLPAHPAFVGDSQSALATRRTDVERETTDED